MKKLKQVEVKDNKGNKFDKKLLDTITECATTIDPASGKEVLDKERFAELIVGECVAAVLLAEVSLSGYMASLIETRVGFGAKFDTQWFRDNWEFPQEN